MTPKQYFHGIDQITKKVGGICYSLSDITSKELIAEFDALNLEFVRSHTSFVIGDRVQYDWCYPAGTTKAIGKFVVLSVQIILFKDILKIVAQGKYINLRKKTGKVASVKEIKFDVSEIYKPRSIKYFQSSVNLINTIEDDGDCPAEKCNKCSHKDPMNDNYGMSVMCGIVGRKFLEKTV